MSAHPAVAYVENGLVIVPIPKGLKGPRALGWQKKANCITTREQAEKLNGQNLGLAHAYSGTCAIDLDDLAGATVWFSERGVDLSAHLAHPAAVQITSGRANRAKLLYKLPEGVSPLLTKKIEGAFELRCAAATGLTMQDVLPPSIHPDTGKPYKWIGDWTNIPELPHELLTIWQEQIAAPRRSSSQVARIGAPEGQRNDSIFKFASKLRADGVVFDEARPITLDAAAKCSPPLDEREALQCLRSAYSYPESFHCTDYGNARRLVARHGTDVRYIPKFKKWIAWDGSRWLFDEDGEIMRRAKDTALAIYSEAASETNDARRAALGKHAAASEGEKRIKSMIELTKSELGVPIQPEHLDANQWLLGVTNGVIDLRTSALREPRRADLITKQAHVEFVPGATCPTWLSFLDRIFAGNAEIIGFMQRAAGYSLTGSTAEQCLFLLWGTGANGKSTFVNAVRAVIGDYATQTDPAAFMSRDRSGASSDIARLRGARLVSAIETEDGQLLAESLVKQLTGQDTIAARFLYAEHFEFVPAFKIWLAANHKPVVRGDDYAIWRRIHLVPFLVQIPEAERDKNLPDKLLHELPGILNWAIAGCLAWQAKGLSPPDEVRVATAAYRREMDLMQDFIEAVGVVSPRAQVAASVLYASYRTWAEATGHRAMSQTKFGRKMAERGFAKRNTPRVEYLGLGIAASAF